MTTLQENGQVQAKEEKLRVLDDLGEIELEQFGEETEHFIWETCYPELRTLLSSVVPEDGGEYTAEAKESIRRLSPGLRDSEFGRTAPE